MLSLQHSIHIINRQKGTRPHKTNGRCPLTHTGASNRPQRPTGSDQEAPEQGREPTARETEQGTAEPLRLWRSVVQLICGLILSMFHQTILNDLLPCAIAPVSPAPGCVFYYDPRASHDALAGHVHLNVLTMFCEEMFGLYGSLL